MKSSDLLHLEGLPVAALSQESAVARFAAAELSRCLHRLTGQIHLVMEKAPKIGNCIVLDTDTRLQPNGYRLAVKTRGKFQSLVIAGADDAGILYGVYALLERFGVGYSLGGELWPEHPAELTFPLHEECVGEPSCQHRALLVQAEAPSGSTVWGLEHFRFFLDQAARLRINTVLVNRDEVVTSCKPRTSELPYGLGRCFDEEFWCSPAGDDGSDSLTELLQAEAIFRAATEYAAYRAIQMGAVLTCPVDDDATFELRLNRELATNPRLAYLVLRLPEGCRDASRVITMAAELTTDAGVTLLVDGQMAEAWSADAQPLRSSGWLVIDGVGAMPDLDLDALYQSRRAWNPELEPDDVVGDFARSAFGLAGEACVAGLLEKGQALKTACLTATADASLAEITKVFATLCHEVSPRCRERAEYFLACARLACENDPTALKMFADCLATRGDWGVLFGQAHPAAFELIAKGRSEEVWVVWKPVAGAVLYRLERQSVWGASSCISEQAGCHYIDEPTAGTFAYQAIAMDGSGNELARSEVMKATCGKEAPPPRILACRPYSHLLTGEGYLQRVVVRSDRELGGLNLAYRMAGDEEWWAVPMNHRFRDSYQAMIPADQLEAGFLEFFVEVLDEDGNRATWPAAAEEGYAWSMAIIR